MPPTSLETKAAQDTHTHAAEPEPDVTVHDDIDDSIFSPPSHDQIAVLAYSYWLVEGQPDGSADQHWLRAERELKSRRRSGSAEAQPNTPAGTSVHGASQQSAGTAQKAGGPSSTGTAQTSGGAGKTGTSVETPRAAAGGASSSGAALGSETSRK